MLGVVGVFFCKQKTAYEMRIRDWSSDVCSSVLVLFGQLAPPLEGSHGSPDNTKLSDEWITKLQEAQQIIHNQVTSTQDQSKDKMIQHHHTRKGERKSVV